jgi:hypothetical protein
MSAFRLIKRSVSLLCLAASALVLYNVYGDNSETLRLAETVACGKPCVRTFRAFAVVRISDQRAVAGEPGRALRARVLAPGAVRLRA